MNYIKYEIDYEYPETFFGRTLYRIVAKKSFCPGMESDNQNSPVRRGRVLVRAGDIGGLIEGKWNLSEEGNCWIGKGAAVFGKALVSGNAFVHGIESYPKPTVTIRDRARVFGCCEVKDFSQIRDSAQVGGCSVIRQYARIEDSVTVIDSDIGGYACIFDNVYVKGADKIIDYSARPSRISTPKELEKALRAVEAARDADLHRPCVAKRGG